MDLLLKNEAGKEKRKQNIKTALTTKQPQWQQQQNYKHDQINSTCQLEHDQINSTCQLDWFEKRQQTQKTPSQINLEQLERKLYFIMK